MNKALSEEMLQFFIRYLAFYKEFLKLETEKYEDMAEDHFHTLTEHVKKEEVFFLKSRSLEKERKMLMDKAGLSRVTFQQMIPSFDESMQTNIKMIYIELSKVLLDLKAINQRCSSIAALRLHSVKLELQKLENHPEMRKIYNEKAYCNRVSRSILSQKV